MIVRLVNVVCKKRTFDNRSHDVNAFAPIFVTELGIVMEISFEQLWNACIPILMSPLVGNITEVRPEQPLNTPWLIVVNELGIVIEVRPEQSWNA